MSAKESSAGQSQQAARAGGIAPAATSAGSAADDSERRRQSLAILEQSDRDIGAGNGRDWEDVKQRMRERCAARMR